ncbi:MULTISPECIES: hypothetical protein [unclassified Duganella]|uniref:hypothetical protein n=1 Tax=unclassified Duganella TaxID=2636909 RepID=UPI0011C1C2D9|nr:MULTISPECIES: hypothetical protein [unclassified Duganella]
MKPLIVILLTAFSSSALACQTPTQKPARSLDHLARGHAERRAGRLGPALQIPLPKDGVTDGIR